MRSNTGADGREDEELMQVEGSCSTPRLHKCPCTADFGQSIFKSSLKSFRLKLLFQRSMRRQHIKPCVKVHSRQETITNSIVLKSPSHYGRLQNSICSQAEVRTQDFTREASVWHPCREMLSPNKPKFLKSHDLWGNRITFNPTVTSKTRKSEGHSERYAAMFYRPWC